MPATFSVAITKPVLFVNIFWGYFVVIDLVDVGFEGIKVYGLCVDGPGARAEGRVLVVAEA